VGTLLASDIVVVSSSDLPIYKNVAGAIEPGPQSRVVNVTLPAGRNHDAAIHAVWEARPDAIVALGARALEMTAREFQGIPIVFGMVADTDEYARTGETAGVALIPSEAQMLKAIRKVLPGVSRVAIIFDPDRSSREAERFASTARGMGITSRPIEFAQDSDVQGVLRSLAGWCDCLVVLPDPILLSDEVFAEIVFRALSLGVPSVGYASAFARKGALISVETDYSQIGSDISGILRRVLEGARPGAIGVNAPSALKITVNQAVAEVLHLGISDGSLSAIEMIAVRPGSAGSAGQPDGIPAAPVP
jgi:putative ABC transport system substrate-binding protein